jgi:hypothetical protein
MVLQTQSFEEARHRQIWIWMDPEKRLSAQDLDSWIT